jgi:hypothetical protein
MVGTKYLKIYENSKTNSSDQSAEYIRNEFEKRMLEENLSKSIQTVLRVSAIPICLDDYEKTKIRESSRISDDSNFASDSKDTFFGNLNESNIIENYIAETDGSFLKETFSKENCSDRKKQPNMISPLFQLDFEIKTPKRNIKISRRCKSYEVSFEMKAYLSILPKYCFSLLMLLVFHIFQVNN